MPWVHRGAVLRAGRGTRAGLGGPPPLLLEHCCLSPGTWTWPWSRSMRCEVHGEQVRISPGRGGAEEEPAVSCRPRGKQSAREGELTGRPVSLGSPGATSISLPLQRCSNPPEGNVSLTSLRPQFPRTLSTHRPSSRSWGRLGLSTPKGVQVATPTLLVWGPHCG